MKLTVPLSLFCLFVLSIISSNVIAQTSELSLKQLLLMPGKLTSAHADIEAQCQKCHANFDKSNQSPLCLDCHSTINSDITKNKGFHSHITKLEKQQCTLCHSDHKGREFNITSLDIEHFEHDKTEFKLEGTHQKLSCNDCHVVKQVSDQQEGKYKIHLKEGKCLSCHEDQHDNKLDNDCAKCHNQTNWRVSDFNHSDTLFPLHGKHQQVPCKLCHTIDVSTDIGTRCSNCHFSKDKHLGVFGEKCDSCHSEQSWKNDKYDHFKETEFRLVGKHSKLECADCHITSVAEISKHSDFGSCKNCHEKDDVHAGNNGDKCQTCHNNNAWDNSTFDHNKDTNFTLEGAHSQLHCNGCHLPNTLNHQWSTDSSIDVRVCSDCHQINDPHQGKLGDKCQSCHHQNSWNEQVDFEHDFTQFPLTGAHNLVSCQSCHDSLDFQIDDSQCVSCHEQDDFHDNTLGDQCSNCHNTASWSSWIFDHQADTNYSLDGAHKNLTCNSCHTTKLEKALFPGKACIDCHRQDDVHQGGFGLDCQRCHNKESFNDF